MNKSKELIVSPDIQVEWEDSNKVLEYYNSFDRWSTYISGGCKSSEALVYIKDGLALYDNKYYLPSGGNYKDWCAKREEFPKDGYYYVKLYKTMDVGIDAIFKLKGQYRPISLDEVLEIMKNRVSLLVDHHNSETN